MRAVVQVSRRTWLFLGLVLRVGMLIWGMYQDTHSALPYTDIDYHVFNGAARVLAHGCPLDRIITHHGPKEDYIDLADPPEAKGQCAQGVLPAISRLMLQTEESIEELEDFPRVKGGPTIVETPVGKMEFDFTGDDDAAEAASERAKPSKAQSVQPNPFDPSHFFFARLVPGIFAVCRPAFRLVAKLGNPYARDTYRYTPLLALLMTPAQALEAAAGRTSGQTAVVLQMLAASFGKILFVLADMIIALLMWDIMDVRAKGRRRHQAAQHFAWLVGVFWLVNPFPAQISTRGSSESLLGVIVLAFVDLFLRAYPEEFLPPLSASNAANVQVTNGKDTNGAVLEGKGEHAADPDAFSNTRMMAPFVFALAIHWKLYPIVYAASLTAHLSSQASAHGLRTVVHFGGLSIYSLVLISGFVALVWGLPFLSETIVYHLRRSDHRHNFSPYFLAAHLGDFLEKNPAIASHDTLLRLATVLKSHQTLLTFAPQLFLTAYVGFAVGAHDLVAGITFQTMIFVAFNKVMTSQYFMWFLWFLPIEAPYMSLGTDTQSSIRNGLVLVAAWVAIQAQWLASAYQLEFNGIDTFIQTWLSSLLVLFGHCVLILLTVKAWTRGRALLVAAAEADERAEKAESIKAQ